MDYARRVSVFRRLFLPIAVFRAVPAIFLAVLPGQAVAAEPRSVSEPEIMREPGQFTDVADGLGRDGQFDLRVTLSYQQQVERAKLLREGRAPAEGIGIIPPRPVASFVGNESRLELGAELGVYRDISLRVRLPVLLAHSRDFDAKLEPEPQARALWGGPSSPLFEVPFRSPVRGGIEYLALGAEIGVFNQFRAAGYPTVVMGGELRLSVTEPARACEEGQSCTAPEVEQADTSQSTTRSPGVSRGTTGFELHLRASRRYQWFEPYFGIGALLEVANADSEFASNQQPPWQGTFRLGVECALWEFAEHFQKGSLDLRVTGIYTSRGQDYSELFDALGSSSAASYREPLEGVDSGSPYNALATGLTTVQAHGKYSVSLESHWRIGRHVRFDVGGALTATQRHFLSLGGPGSQFRPETDVPGQRFLLDTARNFSGWVRSAVLF